MAVKESYAGKINRKLNKKLHVIEVAAGRRPAGPPLELYRVDAHDTNREEEYVTELQMRVE